MSTLLAQRSLVDHVAAVATGLRAGLAAGRRAVAMIVGRDPSGSMPRGVGRAAVESLAENLSDGVVAPLFWGVVAGPARHARLQGGQHAGQHGRPPQRALPRFRLGQRPAATISSISSPPASPAPLLVPRRRLARCARRAMLRDAPRHRSPNAGWPEAAMAGCPGSPAGRPARLCGVHRRGRLDGRRPRRGRRPATSTARIALAWRVWWLARRVCRPRAGPRLLASQRQQPVEVEAALEMVGQARPGQPRPCAS